LLVDRVPVLLGLSYLLVWYRRRISWDVDGLPEGKGGDLDKSAE
jgi:hypothetical protein